MLCHGMAFGLLFAMGAALRPAAVQHDETPMTLTLVAAPNEPPTPPSRPIAVNPAPPPQPVAPQPVEPIPQNKPIVQPVENPPPQPSPIPVPTPAPIPPQSHPTIPVVVADSAPATPVHGDSSSLKPGRDATTLEGRPGVKAQPKYLKNPEPPYPPQARRLHQEGLVILAVNVTAAGKAADVKLKDSSGFRLLDESALRTVRHWEFEPARVGSQAVDSETEVPVRFRLAQ